MTQVNLVNLARQGNPKAIEALINRQFQPKGIAVKVAFRAGCLQIVLEAERAVNQKVVTEFIKKGLISLNSPAIDLVKVFGNTKGEASSSWSQEFLLSANLPNTSLGQQSQIKPKVSSKTQAIEENIVLPKSHAGVCKKNEPKILGKQSKNYVNHKTVLECKKRAYEIGIILFCIGGFFAFFGLYSANFIALLLGILCASSGLILLVNSEKYKKTVEENRMKFQVNEARELEYRKALSDEHKLTLNKYKSIIPDDEKIIFQQRASYRGGIKGNPKRSEVAGTAFVLDKSFVFLDGNIAWKVFYPKIVEVRLDYFQMSGTRGFLASGDVGRQLQQTKNTLEIIYLDEEDVERSAKFQIHGALTIPGEAEKANEFVNYLLEFKGQFTHKKSESNFTNSVDLATRLEKLKKLREQDIITEEDYEKKKYELLNEL